MAVYILGVGSWPFAFILGAIIGLICPRQGSFSGTLACGFKDLRDDMESGEKCCCYILMFLGVIFGYPLGYACASKCKNDHEEKKG
mmetsp:Transcript_5096/g.456  ORF Transcript_5096/g.456 Transcript_5096/m.456 type:complete len:86 (+) Transcript_5096:69-326(+)